MNLLTESKLSQGERAKLFVRPSQKPSTTPAAVRTMCLDVKRSGDAAVQNYTRQFDSADASMRRVTADEIEQGWSQLPAGVRQALEVAAKNITAFHTAQRMGDSRVETMPGVRCWREARPIERVGLYVPAGSAPLPSTLLMLAIPATLAGCTTIVVCSPPNREGNVDRYVLAAARLLGQHAIYSVGGAQAIAAMAYGTETIPKVDKIFGPGNRYVAAAKSFVASDPEGAAIDLIAGPSELLVIADASADPRIVASDLLSQAEHDPDAFVALVTPQASLAAEVAKTLPTLLAELPRKEIAEKALKHAYALVTDSLDAAVRFSNDFAPEHLIVNTRDAEGLVPALTNAGSVFLGRSAPVTAGDYASGTNHTLPTGGSARWSGGVSLQSFQKMVTFQSLTDAGLKNLAPTLTALAEIEGLEAHKRAVESRLEIG